MIPTDPFSLAFATVSFTARTSFKIATLPTRLSFRACCYVLDAVLPELPPELASKSLAVSQRTSSSSHRTEADKTSVAHTFDSHEKSGATLIATTPPALSHLNMSPETSGSDVGGDIDGQLEHSDCESTGSSAGDESLFSEPDTVKRRLLGSTSDSDDSSDGDLDEAALLSFDFDLAYDGYQPEETSFASTLADCSSLQDTLGEAARHYRERESAVAPVDTSYLRFPAVPPRAGAFKIQVIDDDSDEDEEEEEEEDPRFVSISHLRRPPLRALPKRRRSYIYDEDDLRRCVLERCARDYGMLAYQPAWWEEITIPFFEEVNFS
ncbi:hypothetical protein T439DRAFT_320398 [Meredithblackwellia eburnea MCA 4105]